MLSLADDQAIELARDLLDYAASCSSMGERPITPQRWAELRGSSLCVVLRIPGVARIRPMPGDVWPSITEIRLPLGPSALDGEICTRGSDGLLAPLSGGDQDLLARLRGLATAVLR